MTMRVSGRISVFFLMTITLLLSGCSLPTENTIATDNNTILIGVMTYPVFANNVQQVEISEIKEDGSYVAAKTINYDKQGLANSYAYYAEDVVMSQLRRVEQGWQITYFDKTPYGVETYLTDSQGRISHSESNLQNQCRYYYDDQQRLARVQCTNAKQTLPEYRFIYNDNNQLRTRQAEMIKNNYRFSDITEISYENDQPVLIVRKLHINNNPLTTITLQPTKRDQAGNWLEFNQITTSFDENDTQNEIIVSDKQYVAKLAYW